MKRTDGRVLTPDAQEALRMRAIRAVRKGMTQSEAARTFGVSRQHVIKWDRMQREGGWKALRLRKRGPKEGSMARLKGWQAAVIVNVITDRTPDQLKMPFVLWTREAVGMLIRERLGVTLSLVSVGRYLKKWGFTPQKPMRRAWERNPKKVAAWLKQKYPRIRREAKRDGAEIHWGDEMGLRSDHQTGTTYAPKGQTPVIEGTGKRFGCHVISTVTNRGTLRFMTYRRRFTAAVFIQFLARLIRSTKPKVYLIVDNHPVHVSAAVRRWLEARTDRIRMFTLPEYSPELNPDEFLNHDVKANALGRRRPRDAEEMHADVSAYLRSTQRQPAIVRNFFKAESVRYAAH
jgi:transposase